MHESVRSHARMHLTFCKDENASAWAHTRNNPAFMLQVIGGLGGIALLTYLASSV